MRAIAIITTAALLSGYAHAAENKPKFCTDPHGFEERIHMYQGCIAAKAKEYEITGDAAESVAVAAIGACVRFRREQLEAYINTCFGIQGRNVLDGDLEKRFQDWAIQSVILFRSKRLRSQQP